MLLVVWYLVFLVLSYIKVFTDCFITDDKIFDYFFQSVDKVGTIKTQTSFSPLFITLF